jgi:thermitase
VSPETVAEDYEKLAEVEYAEPNYLYTVSLTPNDPLFSRQYGLQRSPGGVDAVGAWDTETGDSRILIGLIDTGVDYNHEDLKGRIVKGPDYINDDSDPMDDNGHGTHLAGTIAAKGNNGKGVAGLCWSCRVLAIKVADSAGTATNAAIARGIVYAASHGAQVINLSLGGTDRSKTLELAVKYANSRGTILIAAIGNESTSQAIYPAAYPGVIAVGATDTNGNRAPFSNYGNYLSLMAPGVSIQSSYPNNRYQALSGTSMSAGFVSGIAALILSKNSSLSNTQVRNTLSSSADDISTLGKDSLTGYGRVNARKALGGGLVSGYVSIVSSKY